MKLIRLRITTIAWIGFATTLLGCSAFRNDTTDGTKSSVRRATVQEKSALAAKRPQRTPDHPALGKAHDPATSKQLLTRVDSVNVYKTVPFPAVIFQHGMAVDSDGSPWSYHPKPDDSKGLDVLADAGSPGDWFGIVTDNGRTSGNPVVQGASDPAPGFYVSSTSLENPAYGRTNPRRYVNASSVPFISIPLDHDNFGGHLGDIGVAYNLRNGKYAYVITADHGPPHNLGEGSVALAKALGLDPSAISGGTSSGIAYCIFPGSGTARPQSVSAINRTGAELFSKFGGPSQLKKLLGN